MANNFVLGKNGVAYVSATPVTDNTVATATTAITGATVVSQIKDLKDGLATDKADVTVRGGSGWKATVPTLKDATITFSYVYYSGDTTFAIFLAAWNTSSELFFAALDKATASGAQGPAGNWTVTNLSRDETLAGAMIVDIELSASSDNQWFVHA